MADPVVSPIPTASPVPYAQFRAEVLSLYQVGTRRPKTLSKMKQVLREMAPFCRTSCAVDPVAISRWLSAHPDRSAATRYSLLSTLRSACSYAAWKGYFPNPFAYRGIRKWIPSDELEESTPFARHRTAREIRLVLDQADTEANTGLWAARRLQAAIYCWAFTGAGAREVIGLRVVDLDLVARIITIKSHPRRRLKTGARAAEIPVAEPLAAVLEAWLPAIAGCEWLIPGATLKGPWNQSGPHYRPTDRVRQLGERAGVKRLTILDFRHSFATLAEDWGIGELMLQRILRHSRPTTQKHYRHHDRENLKRAAAKVHF